MDINPLHSLFAAEVIGLDLSSGPDEATFSRIHSAFEEYAVLVFRDQQITDAQQIAFSERFGELETTKDVPKRLGRLTRINSTCLMTRGLCNIF